MTQQTNDKLFSRLKNKLNKKQQFTTLADYPGERCVELPERCELQLAMKFVRRRRINMKKKYRAVLENGSLELHHPKQKELNGFTIEYRVDLAKVLLLFDEQRVVIKLQTEVLLLYPTTMTVDRLRDLMHQHRLWSQEKMIEKNLPRSSNDSGLYVAQGASEASDSLMLPTELEPSGNPTQDYLRDTHAMSLAILDASSRHLETMRQVVDEVKALVEQLKKNKKEVPMVSATSLLTTTPAVVTTTKPVPPPAAPTTKEAAKIIASTKGKKPKEEEDGDDEVDEEESSK